MFDPKLQKILELYPHKVQRKWESNRKSGKPYIPKKLGENVRNPDLGWLFNLRDSGKRESHSSENKGVTIRFISAMRQYPNKGLRKCFAVCAHCGVRNPLYLTRWIAENVPETVNYFGKEKVITKTVTCSKFLCFKHMAAIKAGLTE